MHDVIVALGQAPVRALQTTLVRRMRLLAVTASPGLDFLFTSVKAYRYNTRGVQCVYFAEDEATAEAEYARHNPRRGQPFVTYFADVGLRWILALCSPDTLRALGLRQGGLRKSWVGARRPTAGQKLGEAVSRRAEIAAVRFPSEAARVKGFAGPNVVIFHAYVRRPDYAHILGSSRKPLHKWP